ncbi:hypothetical protein SAMN02745216_04271 [Desulfatibacillum alkenivorans DSM 16219]|jgi:hypothetical protein|uniref:Uncharacterized protein n=1 Tax=Desulfatibacillum alkenivorans DSM 16219 TaxID=1121393 RepID=A0A1M6W7N6_9BACT|nr:hypothetical protein [Desulfatibacillum alkenivorans]SHK89707.1 hypothetical protein SAMN02745216_04271 [Desulfatibacillum alkenivorans DSM 16219]
MIPISFELVEEMDLGLNEHVFRQLKNLQDSIVRECGKSSARGERDVKGGMINWLFFDRRFGLVKHFTSIDDSYGPVSPIQPGETVPIKFVLENGVQMFADFDVQVLIPPPRMGPTLANKMILIGLMKNCLSLDRRMELIFGPHHDPLKGTVLAEETEPPLPPIFERII